ncbi:MAG: hypothetical protein QOJ07_551 [Thermoleophilaceae bacterium]|nr:hypothetical protein [Thermoleophilaceae bacterium]
MEGPRTPIARGRFGSWLVDRLHEPAHDLGQAPPLEAVDPLCDEDFQLSLYVLYELHYRGFEGVDERWEWQPSLLALRARLEERFENAMRDAIGPDEPAPDDVPARLVELLAQAGGPPLGRYLETQATLDEFREFVVHRSAYQLKEADPHSWAIPRLSGGPKVALVEIQADEYGGGRPERQHARLYANTMEALGLDSTYGAYLDEIPATTLATVNLMSLFGLHRRLRGAIVGHLAVLEMDSTQPNRRYGNALRRLGFDDDATDFYDEHVEADAVHEALAAHDLAGALAADEPSLAADIVFGARAMILLDEAAGRRMYDAWAGGESSLLAPVGAAA